MGYGYIEVLDMDEPKKKKSNIFIKLLIFIVIIGVGIGGFLVTNKLLNKKEVIKDSIAPTLMDVSIYSDNVNDRNYAEVGNNIYLEFRADEKIENVPVVYINGKKVTVLKKEYYYLAMYTVVEQFEEDFVVSFNISDYKDKAGNKGVEVVNTNDFSKVIIPAIDKNIDKVLIDSLTLNKENIYMMVNNTEEVNVVVSPMNAYYEDVIWQSSDEVIVSIEDGKITANSVGHAVVSAMVEGKTVSTDVWVSDEEVEATSLKIISDNKTMYVGDKIKLDLEILPENATNTKVKWSSSNKKVISIVDGVLVAKKEGKAKVTAKLGDLKDVVEIVVEKKVVPVTDLTLNTNEVSLYVGYVYPMSVSISPYNATNKEVVWSSENTEIATVNKYGTIKGKKSGKTVVTATVDGKSSKVNVVVTDQKVKVSSISVSPNNSTIDLNQTLVLNTTILPSNATYESIEWSSSDGNIATVVDGVVTGKSEGKVTITAKAGGKSGTAIVNVKKPYVAVESLYLNATSANLEKGKTITLRGTVLPSNATNQVIEWISSNPSVATVSNGVVTALSSGTAIITAKCENVKVTATIKVIVPVKSIAIAVPAENVVYVGKTLSYHAAVSPSDATIKTVTWTSSDPSIATVKGGIVTGVSNGRVKIIASSGSASAYVYVTVRTLAENITFNGIPGVMEVGDIAEVKGIVLPTNAYDRTVTWSSSNTGVVKIASTSSNMATLSAVNNGTATITARCGSVSKSFTVRVDTPVKNIELSASTLELEVGGASAVINANIIPSTATVKNVNWSVTGSSVQITPTGNSVTVRGVENGTSTIIAEADGISKTFKVYVTTPLEYFTISPSSATINSDESIVLSLIPVPSTATIESVSWKSSNSSIATVSGSIRSASVHGISGGTATITAIVNGEISRSVNIHVEEVVQSVHVSPSSFSLPVGSSRSISGIINPSNASYTSMYWRSSNSGVASVSGGGRSATVIARSVGTTSIIFTVDGRSSSATVHVYDDGASSSLDNLKNSTLPNDILLNNNQKYDYVSDMMNDSSNTKIKANTL